MGHNVLVLGTSGSGKSTSMRNLDPERTLIINIEGKDLPFKGRSKFKHEVGLKKNKQLGAYIKKADASGKFDTIVIDSMSRWLHNLHQEVVRGYDANGERVVVEDGYECWSVYADCITLVLESLKGCENNIIALCAVHKDFDEAGRPMYSIPVSGKFKAIEIQSYFETVLMTSVDVNQPIEDRFSFATGNDGRNTCKSPMGMFEKDFIDNDLNLVIETMEKYE